jgi:hypothetical protein
MLVLPDLRLVSAIFGYLKPSRETAQAIRVAILVTLRKRFAPLCCKVLHAATNATAAAEAPALWITRCGTGRGPAEAEIAIGPK